MVVGDNNTFKSYNIVNSKSRHEKYLYPFRKLSFTSLLLKINVHIGMLYEDL